RRRVARSGLAVERVDLPVRTQVARDRVGGAAERDRPRDFLRSEIGRYSHGKYAPVAARLEVGRLALIRRSGFDVVSGANWHAHHFLRVAIEVSEADAERAVRVAVPPFERGSDCLAGRFRDGEWKLSARQGRGCSRGERGQPERHREPRAHRANGITPASRVFYSVRSATSGSIREARCAGK